MRNKALKIYLLGLAALTMIVVAMLMAVMRFGTVERTTNVHLGLVAEPDTLFEAVDRISVVEITQINTNVNRDMQPGDNPWLELTGDSSVNIVSMACDADIKEYMHLAIAGDTLRLCLDFSGMESPELVMNVIQPAAVLLPARGCLTVTTLTPVPVVDNLLLYRCNIDTLRLAVDTDVTLEASQLADVAIAAPAPNIEDARRAGYWAQSILVMASDINHMCVRAATEGESKYFMKILPDRPVGVDRVMGSIGSLAFTSDGHTGSANVDLQYNGQLPAQIVMEPGLPNNISFRTPDSYIAESDTLLNHNIKDAGYETYD